MVNLSCMRNSFENVHVHRIFKALMFTSALGVVCGHRTCHSLHRDPPHLVARSHAPFFFPFLILLPLLAASLRTHAKVLTTIFCTEVGK